MSVRIREYKKREIEMKYQLMESIDMFGKEIPNTVTSTAEKYLLEMNDNAMHLDEHRS